MLKSAAITNIPQEMLHSLKTAAGLFECVRAWPNLAEGHNDLGGKVGL